MITLKIRCDECCKEVEADADTRDSIPDLVSDCDYVVRGQFDETFCHECANKD